METENVKKLASKIEHMAKSIDPMQKDGRNTHSNYGFVSHEAVTKEIGGRLLENKISIRPSCVSYEEREYNSKDKVGVRTVVLMEFKITDLETGYTEVERFFGAENDLGGKSMQQAITQATKYFYFKLFKIPFGDDGDAKTVASGETSRTYVSSADDKPWYNGFDAEQGLIFDAINRGDCTPQQALDRLTEKYKVNKVVRDKILNYTK